MILNNMCLVQNCLFKTLCTSFHLTANKDAVVCPVGYRVRIVGTSNYHSATKTAYLGYLYAFSLWVGHVWNLH